MLSIKEHCGNVYLMPLVEVDSCSFPKPRTAAKLWAFSPSDASVESVGFVPHLGTTLANLYTNTKKKAPNMPTTGEGKLRGWAVELRTVIFSRHRTQTASTHTSTCNNRAGGMYSYFHGRHTEPGRENSSLPHRRYQMHFKINNHILLTPTAASCFLLVNYKMSQAPGLLCFPVCYLGVHTKIQQTWSKHNVVYRVRFLNDLIKSKGSPHICLW